MSTFNAIFNKLRISGAYEEVRGSKMLELLNFVYTINPTEIFCNLPSRKLNVNYIKKEMLWYLRGNIYDLSIADYASIWKSCIKDGKINSNYGFYWQHKGYRNLRNVAWLLVKEPSTRRAIIPILGTEQDHFESPVVDMPCTETITFYIRNKELRCTVHMRSQDAYFGMGNDVPCFSILHRILYALLKNSFEDLKLGTLTVSCTNFHLYARHFDKLRALCTEHNVHVEMPEYPSKKEAELLLDSEFSNVEEDHHFIRWLLDND